MDLELLLAHADDHRPTLESGVDLASTAEEPNPDRAQGPRDFARFDADPNVLSLQGWGIVAPEGPEGDRLLELVEPLRRQREAQQGSPARIYRARPGDDPWAWKKLHYNDESVDISEVPRYLLILGDIDRVSVQLQYVLSSEALVGRLVCPTEAGYTAYVEKLLRWEKTASAAADARALFFTAQDGTPATTIGYRALVAPTLEQCAAARQNGKLRAAEILEIPYEEPQPSRDAFLAQLRRSEPAMLFTVSHGLGAPRGGWRSPVEQRALQGAMGFGTGARLTAEDVATVPFLPGGMWFFLACFSGGTPSVSAYHQWLVRLREAGGFGGRADSVLAGLPKEGDRPFIAALPQAALANPDGPLAVVAHIDLAWTYSFQDLTPRAALNRPSRFQGVFRSLLDGSRAGIAHSELQRFMSVTSVELAHLYSQEELGELKGKPVTKSPPYVTAKANLWMLRQDLEGYILLGDPAAQLPIQRGETK